MMPVRSVAMLLLETCTVGAVGAGLRQKPGSEAASDVAMHAEKGWGEEQDQETIRPFNPKAEWHPTYGELSYNHDGFTEDWHTEWRQGDFPTWKDMHPKIKGWEWRQGDFPTWKDMHPKIK